MATDVEKLVVQLSADFRSLERSLANANGVTNKQFSAIERRAKQLNKNLDGIFSKSFSGLTAPLAGLGAALGVDQLRKMTDTWTDMTSRVNLAAGSVEKGTEVMGRLGDMARRTYSDLTQTADSYLANATALKELGYSTDQSLDYTEALNNALVVSGAKGDRAARVIDALSKAMGLGKLQGQNLNTILAEGGRVAQALAAGLGATVGGLRKLGTQGSITGNDLVKALSSQMEILRREAEAMPATIGDGFTLLNNALLQYVGNADHATGVSAKISEALVAIADNFDKTADSALQLAAVIAGVLVGRSLGGMIRGLGLAGTALNNFVRALAAARMMGNMATALGGLGAAAGPLGAIIGGALVLSLGSYAKASWDAAKNSDVLRAEMEKLGLIAPKAAKGVDDISESLDKLTDADRVRKLQQINAEIDRLRSGGGLFGKGDELNTIATNAIAPLRSVYGQLTTTDADKAARRAIAQMATDFANLNISADVVKAKLTEINNTNVSMGVVELGDRLRETIELIAANEAYSTRFGDTLEQNIGSVANEIQNLKGYLEEAASTEIISQAQYDELSKLIDEFTSTGGGAEELRKSLKDIERANPNFNWLYGQFDVLITKMQVVIATANSAAGAVGRISFEGPTFSRGGTARAREETRVRQEDDRQYESEQLRRAQLGKDQLALENEIARVKKQSLDDGKKLTDEQIKRIADANLAGNASRSGEGKKPKKERADDYARLTERIREQTAALLAETAAQAGVNPLIDDYGRAATEAAMAQDVLTAAKKAGTAGASELHDIQELLYGDLSKMSPAARELAEAIRALVGGYADADVAAQQFAESQARLKQSADDMRELGKDTMSGFIKDLQAGKSASEALANALSKVGDKLLEIAMNSLFDGGGGGIFGFIGKALGLKGGGIVKAATGGLIRGPGTSRSDSIPARLSDGEFVVNAKATAANRQLLEAINSGKALKLADGGLATMRAPSMPSLVTRQAPGGGAEIIRITLQDDSGRMAQIADQRIKTASGTIVQVSVQQSTRAVKQQMPGLIANAQARQM